MKPSTEISIITIMGELQEKKRFLEKESEAFSVQLEAIEEQIRFISDALDSLAQIEQD